MSNAAHNHYAAREGAAPTAADARREAVTQPAAPPAPGVVADDFRPRVTGAMAASIELDGDPFPDFDPETMGGADAAALARERTLGRAIPPEDPTSPFAGQLAREPYDPETMAFGRRTRGPFARLED